LDHEFGAAVELIKGKDGVFEVTVDGDLLFSKRALGRFPEEGEVAQIVREAVSD
jgi:selenoprotein W-related protein